MHHAPPWDNDAFVVLMRLAQDSPDIRRQLAWIVRLPGAERRAMIEPWLQGLRDAGTPADMVAAIGCLRHDAFADAVARFLAGL